MKCTKAQRLISNQIDNLLNGRQTKALEEHLKECPACTESLHEMQMITGVAKNMKSFQPSEYLWAGIEGQIPRNARKSRSWPKRRGQFFRFSLYSRELAFSGSGLLAGLVLMTLFYYGIPFIQRDRSIPDEAASDRFEEADRHYQLAIAALSQAISEQNVELSPELAAVFEENLEIIDEAIQSFRTAMNEYPDDQEVNEYLLICYKKKLELLGEMKNLMMRSG
ncbi:MAG: zf-HC2 domain-containing protein [Deltaproteobacteria bacterium]|nr:zf-HC2 domain-containing protein [Deltaproteobacteria bacterium]